MDRDPNRLRQAANLIAQDLARTTTERWSCEVDDDLVLTVARGERQEQVLIDRRVVEESWPLDAWSDEHHQFTLVDDATETVAEEVRQVLRVWGITWPICPFHDERLFVCGTTWVCGPGRHDMAAVGELPPTVRAQPGG